jgi:ADP-ribose pyrophosphatase
MASEDDETPTIGARDLVFESPWVRVVEKTVLSGAAAPERYLVVETKDYAAICARRPDGRFLMVRQYRPPLEQPVWEFPSGNIEPGEAPAAAIARELFEETGHRADRPASLGTYHPDPGRLSNRGHLFFGAAVPGNGWQPEPGVAVAHVTAAEIDAMIADGRFTHLQHIALWLMVKAAGLIEGE